jgi:hypothetical protein
MVYISMLSCKVIVLKMITSLQKGKIMVLEDAKVIESMATHGGDGALDSYMLDRHGDR